MKGLLDEPGAIPGKTHPSHFAGTGFWIRESLKDWTKKGETASKVNHMQERFQSQDNSEGNQSIRSQFTKRSLGKQSSNAVIIDKKKSSIDLHNNTYILVLQSDFRKWPPRQSQNPCKIN